MSNDECVYRSSLFSGRDGRADRRRVGLNSTSADGGSAGVVTFNCGVGVGVGCTSGSNLTWRRLRRYSDRLSVVTI